MPPVDSNNNAFPAPLDDDVEMTSPVHTTNRHAHDGSRINDDDEMPALEHVSDSDSSSDDEVEEVVMQTIDDAEDNSMRNPQPDQDTEMLPPVSASAPVVPGLAQTLRDLHPVVIPPSPRSSSRRARVEDDEDEERDRRHPHHRVGRPADLSLNDANLTPPSASASTSLSVNNPSPNQVSPAPGPHTSTSTPLVAPTPVQPTAPPGRAAVGGQAQPQGQPQQSQRPHRPTITPVVDGFAITFDFSTGVPVVVSSRRTGPTPTTPQADYNRPSRGPDEAITSNNNTTQQARSADGSAALETPSSPQNQEATDNNNNNDTAPPSPDSPPAGFSLADILSRLGVFATLLSGLEREQDDPERAQRLVDGLEEVPVGLVKRMERVAGGTDDGTGGDTICAICWDKLIDDEAEIGSVEAKWASKKEGQETEHRHEEGENHAGGEVAAQSNDDIVSFSNDESLDRSTPATSSDSSEQLSPFASASASASTSTSTSLSSSASGSQPTTEEKKYPKIVSLPCAHVFHAACLVPWFTRPKQTTCPTCRFNIDPEGLTRRRRNLGDARGQGNPLGGAGGGNGPGIGFGLGFGPGFVRFGGPGAAETGAGAGTGEAGQGGNANTDTATANAGAGAGPASGLEGQQQTAPGQGQGGRRVISMGPLGEAEIIGVGGFSIGGLGDFPIFGFGRFGGRDDNNGNAEDVQGAGNGVGAGNGPTGAVPAGPGADTGATGGAGAAGIADNAGGRIRANDFIGAIISAALRGIAPNGNGNRDRGQPQPQPQPHPNPPLDFIAPQFQPDANSDNAGEQQQQQQTHREISFVITYRPIVIFRPIEGHIRHDAQARTQTQATPAQNGHNNDNLPDVQPNVAALPQPQPRGGGLQHILTLGFDVILGPGPPPGPGHRAGMGMDFAAGDGIRDADADLDGEGEGGGEEGDLEMLPLPGGFDIIEALFERGPPPPGVNLSAGARQPQTQPQPAQPQPRLQAQAQPQAPLQSQAQAQPQPGQPGGRTIHIRSGNGRTFGEALGQLLSGLPFPTPRRSREQGQTQGQGQASGQQQAAPPSQQASSSVAAGPPLVQIQPHTGSQSPPHPRSQSQPQPQIPAPRMTLPPFAHILGTSLGAGANPPQPPPPISSFGPLGGASASAGTNADTNANVDAQAGASTAAPPQLPLSGFTLASLGAGASANANVNTGRGFPGGPIGTAGVGLGNMGAGIAGINSNGFISVPIPMPGAYQGRGQGQPPSDGASVPAPAGGAGREHEQQQQLPSQPQPQRAPGPAPVNPIDALLNSLFGGSGPGNGAPRPPGARRRTTQRNRQEELEKKEWAPPPAPGLSLRQKVEKKEREAGLRCHDMSCGVGPSDEDPLGDVAEAAMKQLSIRSPKKPRAHDHDHDGVEGDSEERAAPVCPHTFHPACLISSERVLLKGAEACVVGDEVEVSCSVCRGVGRVSKEEWDEGVRSLS
ncbi:hypothetical protein AX16_004584 [Volvariella volvacea WC 439]|nr:hypothetical protein AX16_004584 [Volvariella volvacea WC 439]